MYSNTYNQRKLHRAPQWAPQQNPRRPPLTPPPSATTMIAPPDPISYHSGSHSHSSPHHYQPPHHQQHHHSHSQNHGPATPYAPQPTTSSALNRILNPSTPPSSHSVPVTTAWPAPSRKWEAGHGASRIRSVVLPSVEDEDNGEGSFIDGVPGHNHGNDHEYGLGHSHSHGVHRPVPMSMHTYHPQQIPPSPSETHRYPPYQQQQQQQQQPFISSPHHQHQHQHHQPPSLPPPPASAPYIHPTTHSLPILISSPYSHPQQQQQQQQSSSPLTTHPKYPNMPPHYIDPTTLPLSPTQPSASRPAKRPHRPSHSSDPDRDREHPRKTILRGGDADDDDEEEAPDNWGDDGGLGYGDRRERRRTDYETRQDKERREASKGVLLDPSLLLRYSEAMGDSNAHTRLQCLRMAAGLRPRGTAR